jgi:hypothetical protein
MQRDSQPGGSSPSSVVCGEQVSPVWRKHAWRMVNGAHVWRGAIGSTKADWRGRKVSWFMVGKGAEWW